LDDPCGQLLGAKKERHMLTTPTSQRGVTLIELLIGFALIALLTVMAVPAYNGWLQSSQIRNAAESIVNGMQIARAESVRRNTLAQLALTGGSSWTVSLPLTGEQIQDRPAAESSTGAVVAIQPAGADRISFNGMGWVAANNDASPSITQLDFSNPTGGACKHVSNGPMRCLRIVVSTGGAFRMCDPAVAAGDPRAC
jgi:type IV fimbrial biogenesis protein FimT